MTNIKDAVNAVGDFFWEAWLDYAEWSTNQRDAELAFVFTMLIFIALTNVVLGVVMLWRRPQTAIEWSLMAREFAKTFLFCAYIYLFYYGEPIPTIPRIMAYTAALVTCVVVTVLVIRGVMPEHKKVNT